MQPVTLDGQPYHSGTWIPVLSFESNSIHNCFHHFVTVHGTNNALVKGNVGYKTRGHGYFIEDGSEEGTQFIGNLGLVLHEGAVLPTGGFSN